MRREMVNDTFVAQIAHQLTPFLAGPGWLWLLGERHTSGDFVGQRCAKRNEAHPPRADHRVPREHE